jgi:drug/metabolite transporter (DMT)-like permease
MKQRDLAEMLVLAAIWGGSFLFMRVAAPEFGALALAGMRVLLASLFLLPLLVARGELRPLLAHWKPMLLLGLTNSAIPFACYSFAALHISAGLSSIFNAATPLFTAVIALAWFGTRLTPSRVLGLLVGFVGVFGLAYSKATLKGGTDGVTAALAVGACLCATLCYGHAANFTRRYLSGVPPMAVATGSQAGAAIALALPMLHFWPATPPSTTAWINLMLLAIVCTGVAYILYFRLIAHVGASNASTVTFIIPAFGVAWGALFLGEALTLPMVIGSAVILVGTGLATGVLQRLAAPRHVSA